jgi:uncharacterized membrane protein YccC
MSKLVHDAVEMLMAMPEDQQDNVARAILDYSARYDEDLQLSGEQLAELERRIAEPNRKLISLSELGRRTHRVDA